MVESHEAMELKDWREGDRQYIHSKTEMDESRKGGIEYHGMRLILDIAYHLGLQFCASRYLSLACRLWTTALLPNTKPIN